MNLFGVILGIVGLTLLLWVGRTAPENKLPGDTCADAMTQMGGVELMLVGLMLALTPKTKFAKSPQFPFDNGLDDGEPDAQPQPAETPIG
jgi:DMSO/TMAO reductase YedYZ heme-binding membrane subunit